MLSRLQEDRVSMRIVGDIAAAIAHLQSAYGAAHDFGIVDPVGLGMLQQEIRALRQVRKQLVPRNDERAMVDVIREHIETHGG